ncbi:arsenosugar biosynthesis radical SAM protein ArsS [Vibrio harveyi]|uniref:arsenosugar biosynthesis radical SAM (seleno)protein ArsS n=3 Tax=Vibrio harveyi TaxID=669 RepID=UPI0002E5DDF3|nr:arsenosugar biosynthesis radical SAM (seleno)protein ArsS [Vibrio harveyi]
MNFVLIDELQHYNFPEIDRNDTEILQVNLGYKCNMVCRHCHVDAGPNRKEMMSRENIERIIPLMKKLNINTLDLTGGAPELHDDFRYLVESARRNKITVIDRCNITILFEEGQENLADFLAENNVEIVASLPCYSKKNVEEQRGKGSFDKSIEGLIKLNKLGYGKKSTGLILNLVYNPNGASLPPSQRKLETQYKSELKFLFNIDFNQLYTITNMPIKRFGYYLKRRNQFDYYMKLLTDNFNSDNLGKIMCKNTINIGWDGYLYDCDFNHQLKLHIKKGKKLHMEDVLNGVIIPTRILTADHCYGCTSGQGSSCSGAL